MNHKHNLFTHSLVNPKNNIQGHAWIRF